MYNYVKLSKDQNSGAQKVLVEDVVIDGNMPEHQMRQQGFKKFCKTLNGSFVVPSHETSSKLIKNCYDETQELVKIVAYLSVHLPKLFFLNFFFFFSGFTR